MWRSMFERLTEAREKLAAQRAAAEAAIAQQAVAPPPPIISPGVRPAPPDEEGGGLFEGLGGLFGGLMARGLRRATTSGPNISTARESAAKQDLGGLGRWSGNVTGETFGGDFNPPPRLELFEELRRPRAPQRFGYGSAPRF